MWIKLFWTCYCNDSPINCTGVLCHHVLKSNPDFLMSVLLNNVWLNIWTCINLGKLTSCNNVCFHLAWINSHLSRLLSLTPQINCCPEEEYTGITVTRSCSDLKVWNMVCIQLLASMFYDIWSIIPMVEIDLTLNHLLASIF